MEQALKLDPKHPSAHYYQAELLVVQGRHQAALVHARQAVELAPLAHASRRLLALTHWCLGDTNAAEAEYRRAFDEDYSSKPNPWALMAFYQTLGRSQPF